MHDRCHLRGALQVQHGALQSVCVLLTSGLQAKIGDVGLAQLADPTLQQRKEHNSEASVQLLCSCHLLEVYLPAHSHVCS
jgi:hypothetical protein